MKAYAAASPRITVPGGKAACRAQAEAILRSPAFVRSHRMQRLLQFLVDETLAGRAARLKEYTIAVSVFDRPPSFDPGNSALVRVEAVRLRRLLEDYRREHEGEDEIELLVPKGSYVPVFRPTAASSYFAGAVAQPERSEVEPAKRLITIAACKGIRGPASHGLRVACEIVARQTGCGMAMTDYGAIALYFGWPHSMKNGADRALAETFNLLSSSWQQEGIHIGVASGEVEAGGTTADAEAQDVVTQVLDLAERLAARAPGNAILMSEATRRAAGAPSTLLRPVWAERWVGRTAWRTD